jgi:hypothetical protein
MKRFIARFILVTAISGVSNWVIGHNLPERHGPRYYLFASQFSLGIALVIAEGTINICSLLLSITKSNNKSEVKGKLDQLLRELPAGHPDTMRVIEILASLEEESEV